MPIVQIHLMAGRTQEQKKKLVAAVTEAIAGALDDVPREKVRIILSDMAPHDYAVGGELVRYTDARYKDLP
jgi:4-oxalocrotonate tautomerase